MLAVLSEASHNVFFVVLFAVSIVGLFFFFVLFYRGKILKEELKSIYSCSLFDGELEGSYENNSPYMIHEGGSVLAHIKIDDANEVLIYQFIVSGQINMMRFLVHVQHGVGLDDAIYGSGHVARECKAHKLYKDYLHISKLQDEVNYLGGAISVIEVCKGVAYCYYRLNSFIGSYPMKDLFLRIKEN